MNNKTNKDACECKILHQDVIDKVQAKLLSDNLITDLANFYKVFSDKTRLKIITMLLEAEMCVCDISHLLKMSQSATSHQLRVLRQYKIVKNRKEGKTVYYSLDDEHIDSILKQGIEHLIHKSEEDNY